MTNNAKLLVIVMGRQGSGKSTTWERLFGSRHQSGRRSLCLNRYILIEPLFLGSSPQENTKTKEKFIDEFENKFEGKTADVVLCSVQTVLSSGMKAKNVITHKEILEYYNKNGFDIFIQWLNPGFNGKDNTPDVEQMLLGYCENYSIVGITKENAKREPSIRAEKIRKIILGWILSR